MAASYVEAVLLLARKTKEIVSVIAFGSFAKGGFSEKSDVDLIIVVSNDCPTTTMRRINGALEALAVAFGFSKPRKNLGNAIFSALLAQTGMLTSHFVTRQGDFTGMNFHRIFNTNKVLTFLIVPKEIVLAGALSHTKTLFGSNLVTQRNPRRPGSGQLAKSFVMNFLIATSAIILTPFIERAFELSLEATKWCLFEEYFYTYGDSPSVNVVAQKFVSKGIRPAFVQRVLALRNQRASDTRFLLEAPAALIRIHSSQRLLS